VEPLREDVPVPPFARQAVHQVAAQALFAKLKIAEEWRSEEVAGEWIVIVEAQIIQDAVAFGVRKSVEEILKGVRDRVLGCEGVDQDVKETTQPDERVGVEGEFCLEQSLMKTAGTFLKVGFQLRSAHSALTETKQVEQHFLGPVDIAAKGIRRHSRRPPSFRLEEIMNGVVSADMGSQEAVVSRDSDLHAAMAPTWEVAV
jgi:hypothetical protein